MTKYVTLVPQGGQPVRLANQTGAPWPTTGTGSLVFSDGATLTDVTIDNPTYTGDPTISGNLTVDGSVTIGTSLDVGTTLTVNGVEITPAGQSLPGCAVATSSTGYSVTDPIVSTQAYMIRDIFQTPGGTTISLRLQNIPAVAPTELVVRVDAGWDGASWGQHPAESAVITVDGEPTHVPWTCAPGANPFTIELLGSTWVDDSFFIEGHCYVPDTLIEASVILDALMDWCRAAGGPTSVQLPPGMMYVRDTGIRIPEGCTFAGHGMRVTGFFWADYVFQPTPAPANVIQSGSMPYPGTGGSPFANVIGTTLTDFCVYGNRSRQRYNLGTHALAFGFTDAEASFVPLSMTLRRVGSFGSSGYGIAMQGETIKRDWIFEQVRVVGSDNDGYDFKDRVDGNAHFRFIHCETYHWGLGTIGTNIRPLVRFPNNPITITIPSGDPSTLYFTVPRIVSGGAFTGLEVGAGYVMTLSGVAEIIGVVFNGSFHIVGASDDGYDFILEHTVPLTMDTAGAGGSTVDAFAPSPTEGSPAFDCRARHTTLDHCYAEGWLLGRTGIRQRPATRPQGNAPGGSAMVMNCCIVRDTTPAWTRGLTAGGVAFSIGEGDITLISPTVWGMGNCTGMYISSEAQGVLLTQPRMRDLQVGFAIEGSDIVWTGGFIEDCALAVAHITTRTAASGRLLSTDDPFAPILIGSAIVRVTDSDHGLSTGTILGFYSVVNSRTNGLLVRGPVSSADGYPIVVEDDDHYLIEVDRSDPTAALNTDPFGGTSVSVLVPYNPNDTAGFTSNIHISDVLTINTDTNNVSTVWSINTNIDRDTAITSLGGGTVDDVTIADCHDRGSLVPSINYGTNVQWGPGNSGGIPNIPRTSPNTDFPCWEFVAEKTLTRAATTIDFLGLDYPEIRVEIPVGKCNATAIVLLQVSTDNGRTFRTLDADDTRFGVTYGGAGFSLLVNIANTTFAAVAELSHFNSPKRTFAKIEGGQTYDALGVQDPGLNGPNSIAFFMAGTRALLYVDFGGNPSVPGLHQLTDLTIGGVPAIGTPVSYVTVAITAATWDTGTKRATFTTATPVTIYAGDRFYIQGMTPSSYDGFFLATAGTGGTTLVGQYYVTPNPEPPASATGMGIVADPDGTATAIATEINAYMATLPAAEQLYTAEARVLNNESTGLVVVRESAALPEGLYGVTANLPVVITTTGDFAFNNRTSTAVSSNQFNSIRITTADGVLLTGTTIRVYQKGG